MRVTLERRLIHTAYRLPGTRGLWIKTLFQTGARVSEFVHIQVAILRAVFQKHESKKIKGLESMVELNQTQVRDFPAAEFDLIP